MTADLRAYIESRSLPEPNTGCLLWQGSTARYGYGQFRLNKKLFKAHVTMCELVHGPRPTSKHQVNHHCDTPSCCNPDHLYWGTQSENMQDCVRRGRLRPHNAEKTHCAKGHELSGANVIFRPTGGRRCATCHRRQKLASYYRCKRA